MWISSRGPDETRAAGAALAEALDGRGLVVGLRGPLGAGKTVFAKGVAQGLGIDPDRVTSPSFTIACEYRAAGGQRLAHVDLFRVATLAELEDAGFLDLLETGVLLVVEWSDRFPQALPGDRLEVGIGWAPAGAAEPSRELRARALGPEAHRALARWEVCWRQRGRS